MQAKEEVIFTIIVVIIVLVFIAIMFLVFLTRNNTRKNRLLFENEQIKKEFEQTILNTRLEIQEYTLNHVSREIHDNIGQTLSLARLQLNTSESVDELDATDHLLEKAIADLRTLSHSLNTNYVKEKGFTASIQQLLQQFEKTGKFNIEFINNNENLYISDENGLIIFRVIQEVFNNIIKHARATQIKFILSKSESNSFIFIEDNGCGFDLKNLANGGIGLKNIEDRVKITGGTLSINSAIGKGTQILISLPPHERTTYKNSAG